MFLYCKSNNIGFITIITIILFHTGNGWLGTPNGNSFGWEPEVPHKLQLRGYAVTHMLLYNQLYPKQCSDAFNQVYDVRVMALDQL